MSQLDPILRVYDSDDADEAFRALAEGLAERCALRAAAWSAEGAGVGGTWPEGAPEALALLDAEKGDGEGRRLLSYPLPVPEGRLRLLLATAEAAEEGEVERLVAAFGRVVARRWRLLEAERERDELRQRVEESEALHVLGLAANRSLDPEEVVTLVARSTRTLLGAHYAVVARVDGGRIRTVAHAGLRWEAEGTDPLAERVIQRGQPVVVDAESGPDALAPYPQHAREEMRTGLGVPLSLFGETFGALVVGYRRPYPLQPRDTRLALTLAGHAAVAISNASLHRELARAYGELRHSAEARERFFASMSHELRTPLNSILGYHGLLLDGVAGEVPPQQRTFLESAHRATQDLLLLVNDILDLSKIEAGKMELVLRPVSPVAIAEEALATVHPLARSKGLEIRGAFASGVEPIVTDADRVRQILLNLLSNALKFTERGRVVLSVEQSSSSSGPGEERWTEIRVDDTGPGVPPEDHERIFHEFEQGSGTVVPGGTGLGLPISRKLARLLGGDLALRSASGQGSSFLLRLPAAGPERGTGTGVAEGAGDLDLS